MRKSPGNSTLPYQPPGNGSETRTLHPLRKPLSPIQHLHLPKAPDSLIYSCWLRHGGPETCRRLDLSEETVRAALARIEAEIQAISDDNEVFLDDPDSFPFKPEIMAYLDSSWRLKGANPAPVVIDATPIKESSRQVSETTSTERRIPEAAPARDCRDKDLTFAKLEYKEAQVARVNSAHTNVAERYLRMFEKSFGIYVGDDRPSYNTSCMHLDTGRLFNLQVALQYCEDIPRHIYSVPMVEVFNKILEHGLYPVNYIHGTRLVPWNNSRIVKCPKDGFNYANSWVPVNIEPIEGDTKAFETVVLRACNDDTEIAHYNLQQFAYAYRNQGRETSMIPGVMYLGPQGCGKGKIIDVMRRLFGDQCTSTIKYKTLMNEFTDYLPGTTMLVVDDLNQLHTSAYGVLKPYHTEAVLPHRPMHKPATTTKNFMELIILTSNYPEKMNIDQDDRRYLILNNTLGKCDEAVYSELIDHPELGYKTGKGLNHIAHLLLNYDLTGFNPTANPPDTDGREFVIENGLPDEIHVIAKLLGRIRKERYDEFMSISIFDELNRIRPRNKLRMRDLHSILKKYLNCKQVRFKKTEGIRRYIFELNDSVGGKGLAPEDVLTCLSRDI